jgi:hypothetical protein
MLIGILIGLSTYIKTWKEIEQRAKGSPPTQERKVKLDQGVQYSTIQ